MFLRCIGKILNNLYRLGWIVVGALAVSLNDIMLEAIERYPPPTFRGHQIKIKYVTQLPVYYPTFAFFCNHPSQIKEGYKNYLENQLRKNFNLTGVPISIFFREK